MLSYLDQLSSSCRISIVFTSSLVSSEDLGDAVSPAKARKSKAIQNPDLGHNLPSHVICSMANFHIKIFRFLAPDVYLPLLMSSHDDFILEVPFSQAMKFESHTFKSTGFQTNKVLLQQACRLPGLLPCQHLYEGLS